ncbi:MAG TPA: PEP-CTERM sorting domain-containing protein [Vicinamibacterales bacterium]|nr:PEP-CTERM sorting domain-containing protein [Vicinamibacterales bacterium]
MRLSRLRRALTLFLAAGGFLAVTARAEASPIQFGSNFYDLVIVLPTVFSDGSANTWSAAQAAAAASTFGGVNGHLVTITSAAENSFLAGLATSYNLTGFLGAWIGGNYLGWLVGPEAGQPHTYTNFGGGEPNNAGIAYFNIGTSGPAPPGFWLDDSGTQGLPEYPQDPVIGYFVEYESPRAVPEPATLALLGFGLLAVTPALRRRIMRS